MAAGTVSTATASLNITNTNVTHPSTGVYCFNGLTFTPKTVVVTGDAEAGAAADNYFSAALSTDNAACAGAEQASVESRDDDQATNGGVLQNAAFYVVFG